jgi:flagellum-specific peptidoglycan hydrolase FlgJ
MSIRDFIAIVAPGAQQVQRDTLMFASVTIAQSIWETGGGVHLPVDINTGETSNNLFGRKARDGEPFVLATTWEVVDGVRETINAKFRKFNSIEDSVLDRSTFLELAYYYKACHAANAMDACNYLIHTGYFDGTHEIGYATDPNYINGITGVIKAYNLTQYDIVTEGDDEDMNKVLEYPEWAWVELEKYVGDAYNDKILADLAWVQGVRDRKTTYKDLLLIKILIDERRRTAALPKQ